MALLYGDGDFTKTTGIAVSSGYDCDNQAATCAGLIGVLRGIDHIPEMFTLELPSRGKWKIPFNDRYINYSRDHLPIDNRISDIVNRIVKISEKAIFASGGTIKIKSDKVYYWIPKGK